MPKGFVPFKKTEKVAVVKLDPKAKKKGKK